MKDTLRTAAILLCCTLTMSMAGCAADPAGPTSDTKSYTAYPEEGSVSVPPAPASTPAPTPAPAPATEADNRQYSIHLDGETLTFAADGTIIPQQEQFDTIYDVLTGKPMVLVRRRTDADEQRDEKGGIVPRRMTAIYDTGGRLLHDWSDFRYYSGFGDYIIRIDRRMYDEQDWRKPELYEYVNLWSYKTEQNVLTGVGKIDKLNEHSVLLSAFDDTFIGIMDTGGGESVFRPAPEGYINPRAWYGNILVTPKSGNLCTLMDSSFTPILSNRDMRGGRGLRGCYIIYSDDSVHDAILNERNEKLFAATFGDEIIEYFDGELAVTARSELQGGQSSGIMSRADGTELATGYDTLRPGDGYDYEAVQPATYFVGTKGNTIDILDRGGRVTTTVEIPELNRVDPIGEKLLAYTIEIRSKGKYEIGNQAPESFVGILDSELNTVVPADRYIHIQSYTNESGRGSERFSLLACLKKAPGGVERWDIVDFSGKVLIENLTQVGDAGPNRIAAVKGFDVGLMDRQGNWIAKQSIFDRLEDERGRWHR